MGAGIIPFCETDGEVQFLLHKTFSGRRTGFLVDFGGGGQDGETYRQTAIREFVEETDTMYLEEDLTRACRTPERIENQMAVMGAVFDRTQNAHPDWWCRREPGNKSPPKDWITYFVEVEHLDVEAINRQWMDDDGTRFKKPRQLLWIPGAELLAIYKTKPKRLWKRVRQLIGAPIILAAIVSTYEQRNRSKN